MNYIASITDFFKSPKWMMNLLLGGVCILIPIVGPMVLMGWLITGFWGRSDRSFETFPDFDFNKFGKYLERGLWPVLVSLVIVLVMVPFMMLVTVPMFIVMVNNAEHQQQHEAASALPLLMFPVMFIAMMALQCVLMLLQTPMLIRAGRLQDFGSAFSMAFVKRFISLMWKDILLSWLFQVAAGFVIIIAGYVLLCVGVIFSQVLIMFVWMHMKSQLYDLYLSRGGEAVPLSPKLTDGAPPPIPGA